MRSDWGTVGIDQTAGRAAIIEQALLSGARCTTIVDTADGLEAFDCMDGEAQNVTFDGADAEDHSLDQCKTVMKMAIPLGPKISRASVSRGLKRQRWTGHSLLVMKPTV